MVTVSSRCAGTARLRAIIAYLREEGEYVNRLQDHAVAITGGLGDIGRATATRLMSEGARVALLDLPAAREHPWLAAHRSENLMFVAADVSHRTQIDAALSAVHQRYGRLDVLIANAGMVANQPFLEVDGGSWEATLRVNLSGAFHSAQSAARLMVAQTPRRSSVRGKILFTSSWVQEMPWPEGAAYATSKAGLQMLAKINGQELAGRGITANVLAPGIVMAGLSAKIHEADPTFRARVAQAIPLGEMQTAESVAGAFSFLCSPDSDYMTGATLLVDGGASLVRRDVASG
jgi:NAD(P)-dependent dehydrogenase (short-subunit alcohol dehydrogenase family)